MIRNIALDPKAIDLLGDLRLEEVRKYTAKSVGGLEVGAVPLAGYEEL
ncbi:MAG: hypothetical protein WAM14_16390 [Candidatus Nitrosopolaris sp.]